MKPESLEISPRTAAILLNFRRADLTLACLESLVNMTSEMPDLYVIDNHSGEGSSRQIRTYLEALAASAPDRFQGPDDVVSPETARSGGRPRIRLVLIEAKTNLGFGGGINLGLRQALSFRDTKRFWILNNDIEVSPGALEALNAAMERDPSLGVLGCCLTRKSEPDRIQGVGGRYNPWLGTTRHVLSGLAYPKALELEDRPPIDYVIGAAFLVRRAVLEQAGLFPEDYFLYFEDLDWSKRVRRSAPSFRIDYCLESRVIHHEGATTGAHDHGGKTTNALADYYAQRNRLRLSRRWHPLRYPIVHLSQLLVLGNRLKRREWPLALIALGLFLGWVPKCLRPDPK